MKGSSAPRTVSSEKAELVPIREEDTDESRTVVTISSTSTVKRSNVTTTMAGRGGDENAGPPYASIEAYLRPYPGPVRGYPHPLLVIMIRSMVSEATLPADDGELVRQVYETWDRLYAPPPRVQDPVPPPPVEELSSEQVFMSRADSDLTGEDTSTQPAVPPRAAAVVEGHGEGSSYDTRDLEMMRDTQLSSVNASLQSSRGKRNGNGIADGRQDEDASLILENIWDAASSNPSTVQNHEPIPLPIDQHAYHVSPQRSFPGASRNDSVVDETNADHTRTEDGSKEPSPQSKSRKTE
jgi:hypothetical protein